MGDQARERVRAEVSAALHELDPAGTTEEGAARFDYGILVDGVTDVLVRRGADAAVRQVVRSLHDRGIAPRRTDALEDRFLALARGADAVSAGVQPAQADAVRRMLADVRASPPPSGLPTERVATPLFVILSVAGLLTMVLGAVLVLLGIGARDLLPIPGGGSEQTPSIGGLLAGILCIGLGGGLLWRNARVVVQRLSARSPDSPRDESPHR